MKKYTHVIWDFNGTVLDDVAAGIKSMNEILAARSLPLLDVSRYKEVFGFPVEDYYRRLGLDLEKEDFKTVLAPLWVALYLKNSADAPLLSGVHALSKALRRAGVHQSILSASQSEMLREQLQARGALDWFDEIWGTDSIHAYGKESLAKAWRAAHPEALAVVLGDTEHDFEVAREIGAECILISAGHYSDARLRKCGVPVVSCLEECLPLLLGE